MPEQLDFGWIKNSSGNISYNIMWENNIIGQITPNLVKNNHSTVVLYDSKSFDRDLIGKHSIIEFFFKGFLKTKVKPI